MVNSSNYVVINSKFATTVHTALPIRTASQGVSFTLYTFVDTLDIVSTA